MKTHPPALEKSRRKALATLATLSGWAALGLPLAAAAQTTSVPEPVFGTPGKDSGWIPTPAGMVEAMLEMAGVTATDLVCDLGSGDGRIPLLAAKRYGARGLGVEYNGDLVKYSDSVALKEGLANRVKFVQGDIFATDFTQATVVTLFMPPDFNRKIRPMLLAMKPGTRVVAFNFGMDDWQPDDSVYVDSQRGMLWRVPAKVDGNWRLTFDSAESATYALHIEQKFQKVAGHLTVGNERLTLWDLRFDVDRLRFSVIHDGRRRDFDGRVITTSAGSTLEGRMEAGGEPPRQWRATRGA